MEAYTRRKILATGTALTSASVASSARPEDFGAHGDGRADDQSALSRLSDWLNADRGRKAVLSGQYRVGRRQIPANKYWTDEGALTIRRPRDVTITFTNGSALLMDNLNPDGVGDQFHGILVEGPGSQLLLSQPTVRWLHAPRSRSQGDGIRFHGYPSEAGALRNIYVLNSSVTASPQAGLVLIGCADVIINTHTSVNTLADGFHVNSSGRIRVGHINGINTGDDTCAFVNYLLPVVGGIYGNAIVDPFGAPDYNEFSNTNSLVARVTALGGRASGLRLAQSANVIIGRVSASCKDQAVVADGGLAGGGYGWSTLEPIECKIGTIVADRCKIGLHVRSFNNQLTGDNRSSDKRLYTMGFKIDHLIALACESSLLCHDVSGLEIGSARVVGGGIQIKNVYDCSFGKFDIANASDSEISAAARSQFSSITTHNARVMVID